MAAPSLARVRLISWNLCVLCLLAATVAFSQPIRFEHFTTEEGLPEDSIRTMAQDDRGFLWIGTQAGLVRYDGYEMLTFLPDATDSASIGCRIINDLCLARNGDLWIGSIDNGVSRYSARTGTFTNWWPGPSAPAGACPARWSRESARPRTAPFWWPYRRPPCWPGSTLTTAGWKPSACPPAWTR